MRGWSRPVLGAGLAALCACGDSRSVPLAPSAQLNLTGAWAGIYGQSGSGTALRLTWDATQNGTIVSGNATIVKPALGIQGRGVLTGTLDGNRIQLTFSVPTDSIPGYASCSIAGLGNATAAPTSITGQLTLMFNACGGTGLEPPGSNELILTK